MADNIVKAEYLKAIDEDTNTEVLTQFIPPAPSNGDLGGITQEEYEKLLNSANTNDVSKLKECKVDKPFVADDGKIPRAKNGGVEWVDVGQPTDEQTSSAVTNWLNKHPEATTTVQNDSLTEDKFVLDLRKKKPNYYESVEKMKNDTSLKEGAIAVTLGYYNSGDGGAGCYILKSSKRNEFVDIQVGNLYAVYVFKEPYTINALLLGIKTNGEPCDEILNNFISKMFTYKINKIYFPAGTYCISKPIVVSSGFDMEIRGDSSNSKQYYMKDNGRNETLFILSNNFVGDCVIKIKSGTRCDISNISLYSDSYSLSCDNNISANGVIHDMYTETIKKNGVSGIIVESAQSNIKNCQIEGFSDNGIALYYYSSIYNCYVRNCRNGILAYTDNMLLLNTIASCRNGVLLSPSKSDEKTSFSDSKGSSNNVVLLRVDGMKNHGLCVYGYSNVVVSYFSDQCNFASILLSGIRHYIDNANISRSGQYYAGVKFSEEMEEKYKGSAIYIKGDVSVCSVKALCTVQFGNDKNLENSETPSIIAYSDGYINKTKFIFNTNLDDIKKIMYGEKTINCAIENDMDMFLLFNYSWGDNYSNNNVVSNKAFKPHSGMIYNDEEGISFYDGVSNKWITLH